ncbi:MAG: formate hydrogenlyase [Acidimicrobiales bacterium]|nr:formate hydrogenlyase [Acidimicrobiales bacterium]
MQWTLLSRLSISILQIVGIVIGSPLLLGLMRKIRCRIEGRVGPPIAQPLIEIRKLAKRERIRPEHSSWIFTIAPIVLVATTLILVAITPIFSTGSTWSADLFAIVFLLLIGSVTVALSALDTGTAFGGMGASRAMTIGALAEPALLVALLALSVPAGSSNISTILVRSLSNPTWLVTPERLLALAAFLIVIVAESGRLPVDNPSTHLELTMIHEAMILEYSGIDLALVKLGESMRLVFMLALFGNLFIPWGIATKPGPIYLIIGMLATVAKVVGLGALIATVEVGMAKLRLFRVPELMAGAFVLSVLAVVSSLVVR